jgi:tetratricopeptide (TPR) repeat protein
MSWRPGVTGFAMLMLLTLAVRPPRAAAADDAHAQAHAHGAMPAAGATPLFDNLGAFHRAITTSSPEAQRYFDQGLRLMWAFNLEEAQRSFEQATTLDPTCASCWWGVGMSLGPHINLPALPDRTVAANGAARKALSLEGGASPVEKALIEALVKRYSDPAPTEPARQFAMDSTYADAMRSVARQFPEDNDVVALSAEALMDLHPWDYWKSDGTPEPWTAEITSTLERVLARDAAHPGANHYYIHALEASPHPERALKSADVLVNAMPGAGHMVHMPSHIYERVGRYDASEEANRRAVESDRVYFTKVKPQGFYQMYAAHNQHFLAWTAMKQGESAEAIRSARAAAAQVPTEMMRMMPGMDLFRCAVPSVLVRFGRWDDILAEPRASAEFPYLNGIWHYARGLAFANKGRLDEAEAERDSVSTIAAAVPPDLAEDLNPAKALLAVALGELSGVIQERRGDRDGAVKTLEQAVKDEDALRYSEPADWFTYTRITLGGALLRAGRGAEAEAVFREDLSRNREHAWALYGLAESLAMQKKAADAADAERRFKAAWTKADVKLSAAAL